MAQSKRTRTRNFTFTDFELLDWKNIYENNTKEIRYIGFGLETCPKTNKQHIQGWIQLHKPKEYTFIKKKLAKSDKLHIETCKGTEEDNVKYCSKEGNYVSYGEFITQGKRTDIISVFKKIEEGIDLYNIAKEDPVTFCKYRNGIKDFKNMHDDKTCPKFRKVEVIVIIGPTGTGKTRIAEEEATFKIEGSSLAWWDGYNNDEIILIDEYNNDVVITKLLNILDGYKLRLPIKGGFTYAKWHKVYITSNLHMEEWHPLAKEEHRKALNRRITKIINLYPEDKLTFTDPGINFLE